MAARHIHTANSNSFSIGARNVGPEFFGVKNYLQVADMTDHSPDRAYSDNPQIDALFTELLQRCEKGSRLNTKISKLEKQLERTNRRIDEICSLLKQQKSASSAPQVEGREARVLKALRKSGGVMSPSDLFSTLHPAEKLSTQGGEYTMIVSSLAKLIDQGLVVKVSRGKYRARQRRTDAASKGSIVQVGATYGPAPKT